MEAVEAGGATHNKLDGADYWLKYYGKLPEYYISPEQLKTLAGTLAIDRHNMLQEECWVVVFMEMMTEFYQLNRDVFGTKLT